METILPDYYYSAQPFIAWCLNHYFYDKTHYVFCGAPFYPFSFLPYIRKNQPSSDPLKVYGDYYQYYLSDDHNETKVQGYRNNLKKGVSAIINNADLSIRLIEVCRYVNMNFFFPMVYRIDIRAFAKSCSEKERNQVM